MAGFDVHQHLWPRAFVEALPQRATAPLPRRRHPAPRRGGVRRSTSAITTSRRGSRCSTATGSTSRSSRCSRRSGSRRSPPTSATSSRRTGRTASSSWPPRPADGSRRSPSAGRGPASRACRSARTALDDLDARAPRPRRAARLAASSSSIRSPAPRRRGRPPGGPRSSTTRARCSAPTSPGSRDGQERWPDVKVVFAILAGGGPIQLERLASPRRRRPLGAAPEPLLRHRVLRPPRARAVHRDVRRRAARLRQRRAGRRPVARRPRPRRARRAGRDGSSGRRTRSRLLAG